MNMAEKIFNVIVTFVVMLTGGGFGAYTGLVYGNPIGFYYVQESYVWIGMAAGLVSSYPLAKLYLRSIHKTMATDGRKVLVWLYGTFLAGLYGVICTVVVHAAMALIVLIYAGGGDFMLFPIILSVGIFVGGVAGIVVGGICSLIYVFLVKGKESETA